MKSLKRGRNCVAVSAGQLWSLDVCMLFERGRIMLLSLFWAMQCTISTEMTMKLA